MSTLTMQDIRDIGLTTIRELETDEGILASDRNEIFGCIFGRDSLITSLKLLRAYSRMGDVYFLSLVRKSLGTLASLQGREYNIESGEEPGKIIHEFRREKHEHLTGRADRPWHVYPDKTMKNYDSVDSTPLFLVAAARYYQASKDETFLNEIRPAAMKALEWVRANLANDKFGFLSYAFHADRKGGGLVTQSWMDSSESVFHEDGSPAPYRIAPVEVQGYAHLALRLWTRLLQDASLDVTAQSLKDRFNRSFIVGHSVAFALDGAGRPLMSARSSMGHLLWAALTQGLDGTQDCILEDRYIAVVAQRLLEPDLFEPEAGIRTLSTQSRRYDPRSYHNGSIWPHDNAMIAEGLENFGYKTAAALIRTALYKAWAHFRSPVELYTYRNGSLEEYVSETGQKACLKQAWSAASMLSELDAQ